MNKTKGVKPNPKKKVGINKSTSKALKVSYSI